MPNGRSGGFILEKEALKELLKTISETTVVGQLVTGRWRPTDATRAELTRLVEECPHEKLAVEEQDKRAYVIRLRNEPDIVWVLVSWEAPIFTDLRRQHARWMSEHPGWHGWIAF
jgi:hypothetical protein